VLGRASPQRALRVNMLHEAEEAEGLLLAVSVLQAGAAAGSQALLQVKPLEECQASQGTLCPPHFSTGEYL